MNERDLTEQDIAAIEQCFDAYGADLASWPQAARKAYGASASSPAFQSLRDDAAALDVALLAAGEPPEPRADLNARLLATFDFQERREKPDYFAVLKEKFSFNIMLPASGFAALAAVGFFSGFFYAAPLSPEEQAFAYFADSDEFYLDSFQEVVQ